MVLEDLEKRKTYKENEKNSLLPQQKQTDVPIQNAEYIHIQDIQYAQNNKNKKQHYKLKQRTAE
ncbi:hypothetical protein [Bartonella koehlerae]|uniref:Uncharacterized protein n=1 Tax=Bartonella koehlerae C-29 TaxID=1134510 RepID=A0A067W697_9HYPH|nr:hypothetical protein [Bartonella koehlerae]KEC55294.1 hypothetical protein O9A_00574 [Bartonella koehlerae C-29]